MEFVLRCNDLKCRVQLHDRAVVTTCSHLFCPQCADTSGLSRTSNANRQCPACGTHLDNPDDVVFAALNPSEDYKTSILSGLAPSVIMECASRGLQFYSYQTSQEIIYQEHLAKSLTEKYSGLSQQMDQLIHDANAQIKLLQDKVQAAQAEQTALEDKNHELVKAYREKSITLQQVQKLYQSLKAQVMASHVAHAAGDEADFTLQSARGERYINKIPGTRTATTNYNRIGVDSQRGRGARHARNGSGSSGNEGQPRRRSAAGLSPSWNHENQPHAYGGRVFTSSSGHEGTPSQGQPRSRLPILGGTRANALLATDTGFHTSPSARETITASRGLNGFGFGLKPAKRPSGPLGR